MKRRVVWYAVDEHGLVDLPAGAQVIEISYADLGGLGHRHTPVGVWVIEDVYSTGRRDPLPQPEGLGAPETLPTPEQMH